MTHLTLSRWIGHITLLGIVVLAVIITRSANDQPMRLSTVTARARATPLSEQFSENHFDHLTALTIRFNGGTFLNPLEFLP
jgi:hypothetical protein